MVGTKESVDEHIAKKIHDMLGLTIEYVPYTHASQEQQERWYYETGHCLGGKISEIYLTLENLDSRRVILPGLGGELGRGYFWTRRDKEGAKITADGLLRRFHLPPHPVLLGAVSDWLDGVSERLTTFQVLDIAHIELKFGGWASPQTYGQARFLDHIYPMFDRRIFRDMISLPPDYKLGKHLSVDIIGREWPELLSLPFNQYTGLRHYYESARKIRRVPSKLRKIIRGY